MKNAAFEGSAELMATQWPVVHVPSATPAGTVAFSMLHGGRPTGTLALGGGGQNQIDIHAEEPSSQSASASGSARPSSFVLQVSGLAASVARELAGRLYLARRAYVFAEMGYSTVL